ncbi:hypothetical protein KEM55_003216 [Ascosphaera atra]|nr:hypothetical protein KEM55_003216 [Ascosphaera atra]
MLSLWTAFVYNWSQTHIGTPVNIYFFTINGEYLPLVLTGITLLSGDTDKAFTEITAIFAAYLYERLTATQPTVGAAGNRTRPWIQTPRFVQRWFAGLAPRPTAPAAAQGVYQMNAPARTPARTPGRGGAAATGSSGGSFFGDSWRHRGPGRRLGGD